MWYFFSIIPAIIIETLAYLLHAIEDNDQSTTQSWVQCKHVVQTFKVHLCITKVQVVHEKVFHNIGLTSSKVHATWAKAREIGESNGERRGLPRDHHPSQCPTIYWQLSRPPGRRFARFYYYRFYSAFAPSCFNENLYTQRTVRTHMDDNLICWLPSYIGVSQSCICASVQDASSW